MATRIYPRGSHRGFTLLELLIVLVIFGLIMSALTQGALFARKAWNTQEQIVDRQGDLLSLQNFLHQLLQSGEGFKGDSDSLQFEGRLPRAIANSGHFDIELRLSANRLVLAWRPHNEGAAAPPDMTENRTGPGHYRTEFQLLFSGIETSNSRLARPGPRHRKCAGSY